jgi:AraC family transcriptional activator of pobA
MALRSVLKPAASPLFVPFSEVRHELPPDCLHYEAVAVRGREHQWLIPTHRHEGLHQFQLLVRGSGEATIDGNSYTLRAPAALVVAAGAVHGFRYQPETVGHQVTVPTGHLRNALAQTPALLARLDRTIVLDRLGAAAEDCLTLFEAIAKEFHAEHEGRAEALLCHARLLALWFLRRDSGSQATDRAPRQRDALARRFRNLVELNFKKHEPLAFYAARLKVTPGHLSRACRDTTGRAALELIHERMLLEARRLLAYTEAPVTEISGQLGFSDPANFTKFFARYINEPPSAYRAGIVAGHRGPDLAPAPARD